MHRLAVKISDENISEYSQSIIVIMKWTRKLSTMVLDANLATGMPTSNFTSINVYVGTYW